MEQRHGSAAHGAKSLLLRAEAEVRVLEIRDVLLGEAGQNVEELTLEVRAREDDALHVARPCVLVHVRLERADLLAPERVGKDERARMEEAPVG